jgi:hypothetical protein
MNAGDLSFEVSGVSDPERYERDDEADLNQRPNKVSDLLSSESDLQQQIVQYVDGA